MNVSDIAAISAELTRCTADLDLNSACALTQTDAIVAKLKEYAGKAHNEAIKDILIDAAESCERYLSIIEQEENEPHW